MMKKGQRAFLFFEAQCSVGGESEWAAAETVFAFLSLCFLATTANVREQKWIRDGRLAELNYLDSSTAYHT